MAVAKLPNCPSGGLDESTRCACIVPLLWLPGGRKLLGEPAACASHKMWVAETSWHAGMSKRQGEDLDRQLSGAEIEYAHIALVYGARSRRASFESARKRMGARPVRDTMVGLHALSRAFLFRGSRVRRIGP